MNFTFRQMHNKESLCMLFLLRAKPAAGTPNPHARRKAATPHGVPVSPEPRAATGPDDTAGLRVRKARAPEALRCRMGGSFALSCSRIMASDAGRHTPTRMPRHMQEGGRAGTRRNAGGGRNAGATPMREESMIDFEKEWELVQRTRPKPNDAHGWNKRSARYDNKDAKNAYARDFLKLAGIYDGESVFDMGCGTGTLAIMLAKRGCAVHAADFSEGMLEKLAENARMHDADTIDAFKMSWEDDWSAFGVEDDMVDVAIASRSMAVPRLDEALDKLTRIARRKCCITMTTGAAPYVDSRILSAIGVPAASTKDYLYAFGILAQKGFEPTVDYIYSTRKDTFDSHAEALADFSRMIDRCGTPLTDAERDAAYGRLSAWLEEHIVENPDAGKPDKKGMPEGLLCLDVLRVVSWAFISWDTRPQDAY